MGWTKIGNLKGPAGPSGAATPTEVQVDINASLLESLSYKTFETGGLVFLYFQGSVNTEIPDGTIKAGTSLATIIDLMPDLDVTAPATLTDGNGNITDAHVTISSIGEISIDKDAHYPQTIHISTSYVPMSM